MSPMPKGMSSLAINWHNLVRATLRSYTQLCKPSGFRASLARLDSMSMISLFPIGFLVPKQMTSTSSRSSSQPSPTYLADSNNSNITFLNLLKTIPNTRFTLTTRRGTMSGVGASPCPSRGPSTAIASLGIDVNDVVLLNTVVTDSDTK